MATAHGPLEFGWDVLGTAGSGVFMSTIASWVLKDIRHRRNLGARLSLSPIVCLSFKTKNHPMSFDIQLPAL